MGHDIDDYNEALLLICQTSEIQQEIFMKTYANETGTEESIIRELVNQCLSPFKPSKEFSYDEIIEMFIDVSSLTIKKLKEIEQ